jgi:hypothetical protein
LGPFHELELCWIRTNGLGEDDHVLERHFTLLNKCFHDLEHYNGFTSA